VYAGNQQVCTFEAGSYLDGGSDSSKVGYYYHEDNCYELFCGRKACQIGIVRISGDFPRWDRILWPNYRSLVVALMRRDGMGYSTTDFAGLRS
jgi:hypothetical protein